MVARPGTTPSGRELTLFLRGKLADYKIPSHYHFVPVLDRNPAGKVLRRTIRERLLADPGRRPTEATTRKGART